MTTQYTLTEIPNGEKYSLTNSGKLEVVPIGVGSMLANKHFNTNFLIVKGDTHILVDCGRTAPEALGAIGLKVVDVVNILPTHAHDDHVGGIGTLAVANRYVGRSFMRKPKLALIAPRCFIGPLWTESLKGNLSMNELGDDGKNLDFFDWFDLYEPDMVSDPFMEYRETYTINFGGIDLQIFRTMHVPNVARDWRDSAWSTGVLIDKKVCISGDTRFDLEMINTYSYLSGFMFHDVALANDPVHAGLAELRTLPAEVKAKMHLVHYGDKWLEYDVSEFGGWARQGVRYIFD
ncbi:MBL fold metallo-hydrolase [Candidatus Nomurabacteria bacterium]|nr:MBL fold metallo-hydrolase [Candidatus Nomurabacteria bacterium]